MTQVSYLEMLHYLQDEFGLSQGAIELALRQSGQDPLFLPMVLWQYDLLRLRQLDQVYDWLATDCTYPAILPELNFNGPLNQQSGCNQQSINPITVRLKSRKSNQLSPHDFPKF